MAVKLILITGASSGIGRETACYLAQRGYFVIAGVRRSEDGEALVKECPKNLEYALLDVGDPAQIAKIAQRIQQKFVENPDIAFFGLINNAGISSVAPVETQDMGQMEALFATNVYGPTRIIQAMLPMLKKVPGRIININSGAGVLAIPLSGAYSMSKFALQALSDVLRVELKQFAIKTIVVEPGLIRSPIHEKVEIAMNQHIAHFSDAQREAYEGQLRTYIESQGERAKNSTPALEVSKIIAHALEARNPKPRYGAGRDARFLRRIHWLLNDRLRDILVSKIGGW